jgi:DNA repair exonuclease SbcCD ATPase subunit
MDVLDLHIENFGVFDQKVFVDFTRYEPTEKILIIGENEDAAGADSNGAGKTTLLNAISWSIFGRVPNAIASDDVIHRNKDFCKVKIRILDTENQELIIERTRSLKSGQDLTWFLNDESQTQRTLKQTQLTLLNYFGILANNNEYYNDFLNTTYFSIDAVKAFAGKRSTSRERMDLIARFLNLEVLDKCTAKAKIYMNNQKSELTAIQGQIEFLDNKLEEGVDVRSLEGEITDLGIQVKEAQRGNKEAKKQLAAVEEFKSLTEQLKDINTMIERTETDLSSLVESFQSQIEDLQNKLDNQAAINKKVKSQETILKKKKSSLNEQNIDKIKAHLDKGEAKHFDLNQKIHFIMGQLEESLNCPECKTALMIDDNQIQSFDETKLQQDLHEYELSIKSIEPKLDEYKTKYVELKKLNEEIKDIDRDLSYLRKELANLMGIPEKIKEISQKIVDKKKSSSSYLKGLEKSKFTINLKLKKYPGLDDTMYEVIEDSIEQNDRVIEESKDEIARLKARIDSNQQDIDSLKKLKDKESDLLEVMGTYDYWTDGFPAIRRWMIESFLPTFEEHTNSLLSQMEVGMRVRFDTLKEKKSGKGEMKNEFDLSIIDENNQKRDLETYSGGESKRIGVCVGFALRELTLNKGYSNFNFLLMDEVIDSLDETGIGEFFNLLNSITGLKLLITHNSDLKNRFAHVIRVNKTGGSSTIYQ